MAKKLKLIKNTHLLHVNTAMNSLNDALGQENPDVTTVKRYLKSVEDHYDTVENDSAQMQELLTADAEITKELEDINF